MKIKSKVRKFMDNRKVVEIPKSVSSNFEVGEEVYITKKRKENGKNKQQL